MGNAAAEAVLFLSGRPGAGGGRGAGDVPQSLEGLRSLPGSGGGKNLAHPLAVNTSKDLLKSAYFRHTDRSCSPDSLPEGSVPFTPADDTVSRAVLALPQKYREAVILCWLQGLSGEEAAHVLRIPRSTVYHRLKKAQALLKEALEEWYDAD